MRVLKLTDTAYRKGRGRQVKQEKQGNHRATAPASPGRAKQVERREHKGATSVSAILREGAKIIVGGDATKATSERQGGDG